MAVPLSAVILAVGLSTMVGLFFGIYPAHKASRLNPIEAMRQEI
jgi:putative ABC transport system permease protein